MLSTLMLFALMFATMSFVIAEDNFTISDSNQSDLLISPTPTLYSDNVSDNSSISEAELELNESASTVDVIGQQFRVWFTFNQEKKAEAELQLAKLRLIQARIAAKNNNTVAMEKALDAHDRIIARVEGRMADIESRNLSTEKLRGLERAIQVHENRMAKLDEILSNANLTDEQRARVEDRLAHVENVTGHLNDLEQQRQEIRDQREANRTAREQAREANQQARERLRENRTNSNESEDSNSDSNETDED